MGKLKLAEAEEFWKCADENGDGSLTVVELRHAVVKYCRAKGRPAPDNNCIIRMFKGIDRSGDNKISKAEFMQEMTEMEDREAGFRRIFKQLDTDGNGTLSRDEIRKVFQMAKCQYTQEEIEQTIDECDKNKDGVIELSEFLDACV